MKNTKKHAFVLAFTALAVACLTNFATATAAENANKIEHVVLIGVDGGGAFFKDADMPYLQRVFKDGAVTYDAITSKPSISAQCWGSMLHGVTPEFHGLTNGIVSQRPYPEDSLFPSVFRVIRENCSDASLASIVNWNPINVGIVEENLGVVKEHGENDAVVTDLVCQYLEKNDPTFLFVQFDECDGAGHRSGYGTPNHMAQLHTTDGYIQRIYEACEKRGILDSTLFIVTADHGGTNNNGQNGGHGGWSDAEKYIMIAATGPGIEQSVIQDAEVRDLASIVLCALGLADKQPESWTSRTPSGLFKGLNASERPVFKFKYAYKHREHATQPTPDGDQSVVAALGTDRVRLYLPFDGDAASADADVKSAINGKLYFVDNGYFGKCAQFDDGWIALDGWRPGAESFSAAFWLKTGGVDDDPAILSNKDWRNGTLPGFVLSLRQADLKFNVGDGERRMDKEFPIPIDYKDGWVYVVFVVDRNKGEVRLSYDFGPFMTASFPEELKGVDFNSAFPTVNLGQDGSGKYRVNLGAELDEFILFDGALNDDDVAKLKNVYLK